MRLSVLNSRAAIRATALALATFGLVLAGGVGVAAAKPYPPLFGTSEIVSHNLAPFSKWTGVLNRYMEELKAPEASCRAVKVTRCRLGEWQSFLASLRGEGQRRQIEAVNSFVNQVPYGPDDRNWGVDDYWATPAQFLNRRGDCEDYAITKYISLKALGFSPDDLRIVVVQDQSRGVPHALLVVYLDGEGYVLDNQLAQVVPQSAITNYVPYYSINERGWWLHRTHG